MSELKVIRTNIQPNNTNVLWLNTDDNTLYKFDSNGWEPISAKSSVYTTPFTLIDLVNDFFTQADGYTMPCPQELVDAVRNGLTIVMPYDYRDLVGGYTANAKLTDTDLSLEFLINYILLKGCLIRLRAKRVSNTDNWEFVKGFPNSTEKLLQPMLESGQNIKLIAGNDILIGGNLPAKDILKESTVFLEWYQNLDNGVSVYKDKAGYEAHNLKVYKRIAPAIHYDPDKIVPNTEVFFVNIADHANNAKEIHTGILECKGRELLHSTIFSYASTISNMSPMIHSISVDCEVIIDAAEGGEMPVWQMTRIMIPSNSEVIKNIALNGSSCTSTNNGIDLGYLKTHKVLSNGDLNVQVSSDVHIVSVDVQDVINIRSVPLPKNRESGQIYTIYFHHVNRDNPLTINFSFPVYWEGGENLNNTIIEDCICELTVKPVSIQKTSQRYYLVSLKTYKQ